MPALLGDRDRRLSSRVECDKVAFDSVAEDHSDLGCLRDQLQWQRTRDLAKHQSGCLVFIDRLVRLTLALGYFGTPRLLQQPRGVLADIDSDRLPFSAELPMILPVAIRQAESCTGYQASKSRVVQITKSGIDIHKNEIKIARFKGILKPV